MPDGRFEAAWLDAAAPGRRVVLHAHDYHTLWCSSAALAAAGIDETTPDPPLGTLDRYPDGRPTGVLREWQAVDLVLDVAPAWSTQQRAEALRGRVRVVLLASG